MNEIDYRDDSDYTFGAMDPNEFGPIISPEDQAIIDKLYADNPELVNMSVTPIISGGKYWVSSPFFDDKEPWVQTYSGVRFTPLNPNVASIVIQDIAHSLSMQCRFGGHSRDFYSVAQHSVLVSYLCDSKDALWGLLHDAPEAYLLDVPSPLKVSPTFEGYREHEKKMQSAICTRFGLEDEEPKSVKVADKMMLATEARDLLPFIRKDWLYPIPPIPFKIEPLSQKDAEMLFLNRFDELILKRNANDL